MSESSTLGIMLEVVKIAVECTYVHGEMKERKREEWGSKGTDVPSQRYTHS
jgi:hypothetical protein